MKLTLTIAIRNGGDGSMDLFLCPDRESALKELDKTEEEMEDADIYDGTIVEVKGELVQEGKVLKLKKSIFDNINI
jgi:hypothetical protein